MKTVCFKKDLMKIQIVSVEVITTPTAKGSYQSADVFYKNLTFQGKAENKKIMSFGVTKDAFGVVSQAVAGDVFEVEVVKNAKGYNDWIRVTRTSENAPSADAPSSTPRPVQKSTYETPEERAQKQIYIIRQSSISSAIAALSVGSKAPLADSSILDLAKKFEEYVFGTSAPSFPDVPDFPVVE